MRKTIATIVTAGTLGATLIAGTWAAEASATGIYKNCTALNHRYPHGVGRAHAHDHTSGTPVTNFKHSTTLYKRAMRHNSGLDRDEDGIACEKA